VSDKPNNESIEIPSLEQLEEEFKIEQHKTRFSQVLRSTVFSLVVVAAVVVLITLLLLPVLQITGSSMTETLYEGDIVIAMNGSDYDTGDIIAFYYNNNILVKRVIAKSGDWVDIDTDGNVYVNGEKLEEPYLTEKALGDCNITLPYQVPEDKIFVMGDHRATSIDSRNTALGCISQELTIGKLVFRVWPLSGFGRVA
jgi:signal peptidase I